VAAGRFDCYFEYTLSIWDYAAARLILTEAGGKITDPQGEVIGGAKKSGVLATNGHLHENVLDIIKKYN
jgi:myo-inositol-1(or 4)-monophosphatase